MSTKIKLLAAVMCAISMAAFAEEPAAQSPQAKFYSVERGDQRDNMLKLIRKIAADRKHDLLNLQCPYDEDARWASVKSAKPGLSDDAIRKQWAETEFGKLCISVGFKP
jgi:hypothetical protein